MMLHLYVHYEIYQMIGIYSVFQGTLFATVMQLNATLQQLVDDIQFDGTRVSYFMC